MDDSIDAKNLKKIIDTIDKKIYIKLKKFIEFYTYTSKLDKTSCHYYLNKVNIGFMYNELKQYYAIFNIIKNEIL
jgi:hypothetical protein